MSERFPVFISVVREDGRSEQVRIGSAVRAGEGFTLTFEGNFSIGGAPAPARAATARAASSSASRPSGGSGGGANSGLVFPNYGRSKGMPIFGASMQDLEFYANGSRRTLADSSKARWHDKERQFLAALEAEIARQQGGGGGDDGIPPPGDGDVPPPGDDDAPPF